MAITAVKVQKGSKVRYAVAGLGWIAQAEFMPGVAHTGNSEMVALVTSHDDKAAKLGEKYGISAHYSYDEIDRMLGAGAVDAVYLATPNADHVELAVKILEAGVHLLLEKPMALSVAECERIIAASEQTGAKLMIAYRLHHEPGTLAGLKKVRDGEIGTVKCFNSTFSQKVASSNHRAKYGWAGPIMDMGPYPLNAVRNLFGAEPIEVFATGVCTDPETFRDQKGQPFEDTVSVTLKFEGNRIAAFTLCYSGGDVDDYRVIGSKGDLFSEPAYQVGMKIEHEMTVDKKEHAESFKLTDHFGGELKYFSDCILEDKRPEADGEEGMLDVRVLVAIEQSVKTGQVIKLPSYYRSRRPVSEQVEKLSEVEDPKLYRAKKPTEL